MLMNKGVMISRMIAFVIMGAAYGSIYGDMQTFLESNEIIPRLKELSTPCTAATDY